MLYVIRSESMMFPHQFADRQSLLAKLREDHSDEELHLLVSDGSLDGRIINEADLEEESNTFSAVNDPSLVYSAMNRGSVILPIASFLTNQDLRTASLHCLIDYAPLTNDRLLDKWTENSLVSYLTMAFHQIDWLDRIVIPMPLRESRLPLSVDRIDTSYTVITRG